MTAPIDASLQPSPAPRRRRHTDVISAQDEDRDCALFDSCYALRRALIAYGLRNDSDLGMGIDAFMLAAREHGLV